jgi:pimeloyl-ACP methyl ester carboxylesterase
MTRRPLDHDVLQTDARQGRLSCLRLSSRGLLACLILLLSTALAPGLQAASADQSIVELPVSFQVSNTNTSWVPCFSDGASYTVKGHITAPQGALATSQDHTITVYLYGQEGGEWNWDLKGFPGYDHAAEMARLGHISLTIDELGYGASGRPKDGNLTCVGAEADVTHQIIQQLRNHNYVLGSGQAVGFAKVVLAGHDIGGQIAQIEAYSYSDIDALIVMTYADQGFTPWIIQRSAVAANDWCTTSPSGYVHFVSSEEWRTLLFHDADPRIIEATDQLRNPNPCGIERSIPTGVEVDTVHDADIKVPVLVVFGDNDTLVWTREGQEQQQDNYGSSDKRTVFIPNAGHFPMFEKTDTAKLFRSTLSSWLDSRLSSRP